jgi:hypothetical protein
MRRVGFALFVLGGTFALATTGACSGPTSVDSLLGADGQGGTTGGAGGSSATSGQGGQPQSSTSSTSHTGTGTGGGNGSSTSSSTTATGTGGAGTGGAGTGGSGAAGAGGGAGLDGGKPPVDGGLNGCDAATKLVYVFTSGNDIYSFDPPSKQFIKIATPDCQAGGTPNSMAIDRNLVAWINYIGDIYEFDLKKKSGCQPSGVALPLGFEQLGMGFSTDVPGGVAETLYVDAIGGGGLAKIKNGQLTQIGPFGNDPALAGQNAELTGTGDAKLFGYFTTSPDVRVAEIDKATGNILSDHALVGVSPPSSWAFSFWGGDFYLYAAPGSNASGNSSVIKYDPVKQTVDPTYVADVGFTIVGAGVSTCAPIVHQ